MLPQPPPLLTLCLQVRISAATALCTVHPLPNALTVWDGLLQAVQASDEMDDFSEFKHRSTLRGKLCELLCHLLSHPSKELERDMDAFLKENTKQLVQFVSSVKVRAWYIDTAIVNTWLCCVRVIVVHVQSSLSD